MLRWITRILLVALVAVAVAVVSFWLLAQMREDRSPVAAAGEGAEFVTVDGLRMHYRQWGPSDGDPLLLVPGSMAWSETFRDIAAPLGEQGHRVIAIDLQPFGYSERPADHDYSRAAQAKRILGFADALGLGEFSLGVHSYGGGAALEAAFSAPERVRSMVLLDVALGLGRENGDGPPLGKILSIGPLRDIVMSLTFTNPLMIGKGLRDFIHDDTIVTDERIALYWKPMDVEGTSEAIGRWLFTGLYADERGSRVADRANYKGFDKPVLVIWGREDTVTPLGQGEEIAAMLPRGRLEVLDGVNHIPHVEKPAEVTRLISDFLGNLAGKQDRLKIDGSLRGALTWNHSS